MQPARKGARAALTRRKGELVRLRAWRLEHGEVITGAAAHGLRLVACDVLVYWPGFRRRADGKPYLSSRATRADDLATVDTFERWFWTDDPDLVVRALRERERAGAPMSHADAGELAELSLIEVLEVGVSSMHAVDETPIERASRHRDAKRAADRARSREKRRKNGLRPQAKSLSKTKPWEALGMSRSKFYRAGLHCETILSRSVLLKGSDETVSFAAQAEAAAPRAPLGTYSISGRGDQTHRLEGAQSGRHGTPENQKKKASAAGGYM